MNRHASALVLLSVLGLATAVRAEPLGGSVRLSPSFTDVSPPGDHPYLRTDSASFLSDRQRIVSLSAFEADIASPRSVSAHTVSTNPPLTLPPLHLA